MNIKQVTATILLSCILAISALAFLCTMPMALSHNHCSDAAMTMIGDGTMTESNCVGTHFSTYLQTAVAVFGEQFLTILGTLFIITIGLAFWLQKNSVRLSASIQTQKDRARYRKRVRELGQHRSKELFWNTLVQHLSIASAN